MNTKIVMLAVALTALAAGLYLGAKQNPAEDSQQLQSQMQVATLLPANLKTIPDVSFTDQAGKQFSKENFTGKWQLLFFGYTNCPDVCPMTMTLTSKVAEEVNNAADDKLQVVFITVDPARDTPERLGKYMAFFNPEFIGLNSSDATLQALSRSLGVVYQKVENPDQPENYLMDHSANLLLLAPSGDIIALFSAPHEASKIAADISLIQNNFKAD